jgi:hypothetical protein
MTDIHTELETRTSNVRIFGDHQRKRSFVRKFFPFINVLKVKRFPIRLYFQNSF